MLVGRAAEAAQLIGLVDRISERGDALVLQGDAGIGKSALLTVAAEHAQRAGVRVLRTGAAEPEQYLPFAGLHQIVHPIRGGIDALAPPQRDALRGAMGLSDTQVSDVYLVGLAVLDLLAETATASAVLVIAEDAHWLDQSSAEVLAFVARRLDAEPVVVLAAVRDGVDSQLRGVGLRELHLEPLSDDAAGELLDSEAPRLAPELRASYLAAAQGNPLALRELPRVPNSSNGRGGLGPDHLPLSRRLESAFTSRVADLPEATRLLLLAAALNDGTALSEALEAGRAAHSATLGLGDFDPAVDARLIAVADAQITFRHPLVRSAIAQSASLGARSMVHEALAAAVDGQLDRRAWHRAAAAAGPDEAVAAELESVALRAQRRGGVINAVATLGRAAQLSPEASVRIARLLQAAELAVESGKVSLVEELLGSLGTEELSARQRARVALVRVGLDDGVREDPVGLPLLAQLGRDAGADGDVDLALRILWSAARRCFWLEPQQDVRDAVTGAAESLAVADNDPRLLAVLAYAAPLTRGAIVNERLAELADHPPADPVANRLLGTAAVLVGAFELSAHFSAASVTGLRAEGRLMSLTRALAAQAWSVVRRGDVDVAIPIVEEAGRLALETAQPVMYAIVRAAEAELAALRGDSEKALGLASEAEHIALPIGARPVLATVQTARGVVALGDGRFADAFSHLRRMHDPADPSFHLALRCYAITDLAEAAARGGEQERVTKIIGDAERIGAVSPAPALHAGLRYARAVLAEDDEDAERNFAAAMGPAQTWPFVRARAQLAYGERLRRGRRQLDSREYLRAARDTFEALGVVPWRERARQELRAAGEASPHRGPEARERLTDHELHIAQLAAQGLTNKEIGQRLYLSHRTVSSHLYRIFPKLGITSRSELAAVITARNTVT